MRFVIYDDESLEPITVLNLPLTYSDIDRRIEERGRRWRVAVPPPRAPMVLTFDEYPANEKMLVVDLEFEPFVRNSRRHGEQRSWFCYTRATDLAMLLNRAWLPGQLSAVNYLQDQNDALTRLLMRAF
jgi:hypothetical protein